MRILRIILLAMLLACSSAMAAPKASAGLPRFTLFGRDYHRVSDWAKANGLAGGQTRRDGAVEVGNSAFKMILNPDSRRAEINGLEVWLSFPIAKKDGEVFITPLDLRTAVNPVLNPPRNAKGQKLKTICLDPGHGGRDPGNQEGRYQEKVYALLLAQEIQKLLVAAGLKVITTRSTDAYVDLAERPAQARRRGAQLFVSLHYNSAGAGVRGAETYCMSPAFTSSTNARGEGAETGSRPGNRNDEKNLLLAYQVHKALMRLPGAVDRGLKRARFLVLNNADIPAVLVEGGFMTDATDMRNIQDTAYRKKAARAIADGILAYKRLVER